ncbi:MAG: ABC transporter family protein [Legionellales bacterium]|nr:ABC transporter family protein [Legionellales bacterium]
MTHATSRLTVKADKLVGKLSNTFGKRVLKIIFNLLPNDAKQQILRLRSLARGKDFDHLNEVWQSSRQGVATVFFASLAANFLSLAFPLTLLQIYDRIIPNEAIDTLTILLLIVVTSLSLEYGLKACRSYVSAWTDAKFEHALNTLLFRKVLRSKLDSFEKHGAGLQLERLNAIHALREFYLGQLIVNLVDFPFIFIFLGLIAYISGWLVLIPIVLLIILTYLSTRQGKTVQRRLKERREQDDKRMNFIIESLEKIHTVKALGMEAQILRRYERLQSGNTINNYLISQESNQLMVTILLIAQCNLIFLAGLGSMTVISGQMTMGGLIACTILAGRCLNPINQVIGLWTRIQTIQISEDKILEILDLPSETDINLPDFPAVKGNINLENISINRSYDASCFKSVNLDVKAGEMIGFLGDSKKDVSTLFRLILGIEKPENGQVFIDKENIFDYNLYSLRPYIAYLPNKVKMFNGTIMENLTFFDPNNIETALTLTRNLGISQFIEKLPKGYDTEVGKHSVEQLPKGTLQIVSIARSLVTRPRIILFDEANSELDGQADAVIKEVLNKIKSRYTILIKSQRPSVLKIADRIYKLTEKGLEKHEY